ncbi:MAG: DUF5946 family protein [Thermomicrobiales bacterium]
MHCEECGADPTGAETCLDRFHALLAAEANSEELRQLHGLTVLTYHLQHSSLTKPWYLVCGAEVMRRVFARGENWLDVLLENHPRGVGRRQSDAAVKRLKALAGPTMPDWVITRPIPGELTVVSVDPHAPSGQAAAVMAWARWVAEHRYLGLGLTER